MDEFTSAADFENSQIPKLQELDDLLRCHICKDFLKNPVLTPCGHTYCSLCIRGYLSNEPKCPLCLNELRESMLRSEYLVNEITESYRTVRGSLLSLLQRRSDADSSIIEVESDRDTSVQEIYESSSDNNSVVRNVVTDDDIQIVGTKRTAPSKRIGKTTSSISEMFSNKRLKTTKRTSKEDNEKTDMAACPICTKKFPIRVLERSHLDDCLSQPPIHQVANVKKKSTPPVIEKSISHIDRYLNSTDSASRQRLPKLNFANLTTAQLKQKLSSLSLPTTGSRGNMVARYNYYEMLWNSNFIDSISPVPESELRRQLVSWDANHNIAQANNNTSNSPNTISQLMKLNSRKKDKEYEKLLQNFKKDTFDRKGWIEMHKTSFNSLLKEAKFSRSNTGNTEASKVKEIEKA
ncbi:Postreplication repair E3 ubiquitin-protein ligase RAD18 [Nakaseomyces bracarensis]|uniref:Postreplication repair E3 ubiquitin-protein ligase RAD18 n=1 Tax=Nakaseomyces bracarensis TaxID=273131 RepID=A0ABR4P034_9SACH